MSSTTRASERQRVLNRLEWGAPRAPTGSPPHYLARVGSMLALTRLTVGAHYCAGRNAWGNAWEMQGKYYRYGTVVGLSGTIVILTQKIINSTWRLLIW